MTKPVWNPRGIPSWPDWRKAEVGTRVRHVRSGWTGTVVFVNKGRSDWGVRVAWDQSGTAERVVAPAFDLEPTEN